MGKDAIRAVVMDDHQIVRDSVRRLLIEEFGASEVLEAADLEAGLELLAQAGEVDLIICDLNMPGSSGPESLGALVEAFPNSRIVVMSGSEDKEDVLGSLYLGVRGYIPKSLPVAEMIGALQTVLDDQMYVPRALQRRGVEAPPPRPRRTVAGLENLTPRQREVLDELLQGRSSKEIARTLGVAEGTVKIHLAAIYRAIGVSTRAEAIARLAGR